MAGTTHELLTRPSRTQPPKAQNLRPWTSLLMRSLFQLLCFSLLTAQTCAQDVQLFATYERKGPVSFVDKALDGVGGGFRFALSEQTFYLDLRASYLWAEDDALSSTRHEVLERSASLALLRPIDLHRRLHLDLGAEMGYYDRQYTEHYLSSFQVLDLRGLALGSTVDLRYRVGNGVEPFLALAGSYCIPLSEDQADLVSGPVDLQGSFEWSLRVGIFLSLPQKGVE
jgi:hypothetical protein